MSYTPNTQHLTPRTLVLAGPTASGKSALALLIAAKLDAVIINADSKQVYHEIPIITAQPSQAEQAQTPHLLYGHIPASRHYSVADWVADATDAIKQVRAEGKVPLLVGGTGMYIKSLVDGMSAVPETTAETRAQIRKQYAVIGNDGMYALLESKDPVTAARLNPGDTQRVLRAMEVIEQTGISITDWQQKKTTSPFAREEYKLFFLDYPREQVYENCNTRFLKMMEAGVMAEVEAFDKLSLDETLPAMKAHGVPELRAYLHGTMSLEDAIAKAQQNTRNYIKRQYTWFRHQMEGMVHLQAPEKAEEVMLDHLSFRKTI